jgi:hypothetical protein
MGGTGLEPVTPSLSSWYLVKFDLGPWSCRMGSCVDQLTATPPSLPQLATAARTVRVRIGLQQVLFAAVRRNRRTPLLQRFSVKRSPLHLVRLDF